MWDKTPFDTHLQHAIYEILVLWQLAEQPQDIQEILCNVCQDLSLEPDMRYLKPKTTALIHRYKKFNYVQEIDKVIVKNRLSVTYALTPAGLDYLTALRRLYLQSLPLVEKHAPKITPTP